MTILDPEHYLWPVDQLRGGLEALVSAAGFPIGRSALPEVSTADELEWLTWLQEAPRTIGLAGSLAFVDKEELLSALVVPGIYIVTADIEVEQATQHQFVALVSEGMRCRVIGRHGAEKTVSSVAAFDFIAEIIEAGNATLARIFASVAGGPQVLTRMNARENLSSVPIVLYSYRPDAASPFSVLLASAHGRRDALVFVGCTALQVAATVLAGVTLGSATLDGLIDVDRVLAWVMISLVAAPFAYAARMAIMRFSLTLAASIKRRSLEGTFFLDEAALRRDGYGTNIAKMSQASILERLSLNDVLGLMAPLVMVGLATYLFVSRNRHWPLFVALEGSTLVALAFVFVHAARLEMQAYVERTALSGDLVEKLLGHRTRAVQSNPSGWHVQEDRQLSAYALTLRRLDRYGALAAAAPRLWLFVSGTALCITFVFDGASTELVYSAGAVVLFGVSVTTLAAATQRGAMLFSAWHAVRGLLEAGRTRPRPERPAPLFDEGIDPPTVLATSNLAFSYRTGGRSILQDASLRIQRGERVLLEGPSGGGKSTFAKILAGELRPSAGSVLVSGLDPFTGSEAQWRRLVASVPQFHENHVFAQTFAFNVDPVGGFYGLSAEAEEICRELDLGQVLSRMPAGGAQLLGETGWQLSHGERSRVFLARALLQRARLVILDESFAALDPDTMQKVIACVRRRAATLIVIAHV